MNELWNTWAPFIHVVCIVLSILTVCLFAVFVITAADDFWHDQNKDEDVWS